MLKLNEASRGLSERYEQTPAPGRFLNNPGHCALNSGNSIPMAPAGRHAGPPPAATATEVAEAAN